MKNQAARRAPAKLSRDLLSSSAMGCRFALRTLRKLRASSLRAVEVQVRTGEIGDR